MPPTRDSVAGCNFVKTIILLSLTVLNKRSTSNEYHVSPFWVDSHSHVQFSCMYLKPANDQGYLLAFKTHKRKVIIEGKAGTIKRHRLLGFPNGENMFFCVEPRPDFTTCSSHYRVHPSKVGARRVHSLLLHVNNYQLVRHTCGPWDGYIPPHQKADKEPMNSTLSNLDVVSFKFRPNNSHHSLIAVSGLQAVDRDIAITAQCQ